MRNECICKKLEETGTIRWDRLERLMRATTMRNGNDLNEHWLDF